MSYLDDPRVLFADERTLLAWQRTTTIAMMGFGFVVERLGLFVGCVALALAIHFVTSAGSWSMAAMASNVAP